MRAILAAVLGALLLPSTVEAQQKPLAPPAAPPRTLVEIYRIAPGMHQAFLEEIAKYDTVNRTAGLPARQLYVHSDGAAWDFMLIQPAATPPDKAAALDKAWEDAKLPSGSDFFLHFRKFVAEHEDTFVQGPTTAADFLARRAVK